MNKQQERDQFIAVLTRELADLPAQQVGRVARLLIRHAVTHGRLAEMVCNVAMNERETAAHEKREAQIERRIAAICAELGIRPNFGGDPRGYTVKVHLPSGRFNTWGGAEEGYGVPQ